jgi:lipid-A-disaccharide synthase
MNPKTIMIVAGESSGDQHGAHLVAALKKREETLTFCGIGGAALKAAGVDIKVDSAALCVVGITEVFARLPQILNGLKVAKNLLKTRRPDLLILIDFPDFNLRVAAAARKLNIPVLYYVSPQIWAWRQGRVYKIKRLVDHVAVILPFEETFYKRFGVPATFVGHPLLDGIGPELGEKPNPMDKDFFTIGLLPGSRHKEVLRHIPIMLAAAEIVNRRYKSMEFLISVAPGIDRAMMEEIVAPYRSELKIVLETGVVNEVFEKSDLLLSVSGTVTLEATLAAKPLVMIYKVSSLSALVAWAMIRVKYYSLTNLIADKQVLPELMQLDANAANIADHLMELLDDDQKRAEMMEEMAKIRAALGGVGASARTAEIALKMITPKPKSGETSGGEQ